MTYEEETFILDSVVGLKKTIKQLKKETQENNKMLRQIIGVLNYWIANSNNENNNDFGRNMLANLISDRLSLINKRR